MSVDETSLDERARDYVLGRLDADETAAFEAALASDAALQSAVAFERSLREAARANAAPAPDPALGWARLSRAIDKDRREQTLAAWKRPSAWRTAAVAACAVLVSQAVVTPILLSGGEDPAGYAPVSEAFAGPSLQATFQPGVTEQAMRTLIHGAGGTIADGPGALGVYVIRFEDEAARDAALARFQDAGDVVATTAAL